MNRHDARKHGNNNIEDELSSIVSYNIDEGEVEEGVSSEEHKKAV